MYRNKTYGERICDLHIAIMYKVHIKKITNSWIPTYITELDLFQINLNKNELKKDTHKTYIYTTWKINVVHGCVKVNTRRERGAFIWIHNFPEWTVIKYSLRHLAKNTYSNPDGAHLLKWRHQNGGARIYLAKGMIYKSFI